MFTTKNLIKIFGKHFLIAIAAILVATIAVSILSSKITEVSTMAAKDRHTATLLSEQTALFANLKHEAEIIGTNDTLFKNAFIPSNNILAFVSDLESLALRNGLTQAYHFSSPVPSTISSPLPLESIGYQDSISTNIDGLINYLKDFEQMPYFTEIDTINIAATNGDWHNLSNVSFSASVATQPVQ